MKDFREMLTLGRVRGIYDKNGVSNLPTEDLRDLRDWLDLLSDEIYLMKRTAVRELGKRESG